MVIVPIYVPPALSAGLRCSVSLPPLVIVSLFYFSRCIKLFILVLIFIPLMTDEDEHFLMYLLAL